MRLCRQALSLMYSPGWLKRVNMSYQIGFTDAVYWANVINTLIHPEYLKCLAIPLDIIFKYVDFEPSARSSEFPTTKRIRIHNVFFFVQSYFPPSFSHTLRHGRNIQFLFTAIQFVAKFHSENNFHCCSTYALRFNHIKLDIYLIFAIETFREKKKKNRNKIL